MMKKLFLIFSIILPLPLVAQQPKEIQKSIYFGGGSWYIDGEQRQSLWEIVNDIPNIEFYEISIMSHTDPIGGREFNERLSRMRSQSVIDLLRNFKVPQEIIKFKDFAFDEPAYDNNTWEGRARNRRVDILFTPIAL
ncbi:OmpA family protein [Jiulongibacter sediminis]|uniref:OmpA family protein n=1 Tax=Jiulongibacter sediminis TaxID=1605367 RepID=UPI0006DC500D|nr:OmpA family protein [Jiulongibacter sediminis]